jgi:glycosyltransferase involved in cell wall biosynthesis
LDKSWSSGLRILLTAYVRFANALAWHCRELAEGLLAAGHEVFVLAQRGSPLAGWLLERGIPHDAGANLNRVTPVDVQEARRLVANTLDHFKPEVLNPHCPPGHLYLSLYRRRHVPGAVLIRTASDPRYPKKNFVNQWLHRTIADGVIVSCHASQRRYLNAFRLRPEKVRVIYPGFEGETFAGNISQTDFRRRYGIDDDAVLLGVVARLSPEKGHRFLLEAFSRIAADFPKAGMLVVGEDAAEQTADDLARFAGKLGIADKIVFAGKLGDVREAMVELAVGVIPSLRSEAICRVALEYMSLGIPIVATDVNILPDIVREGINGWIVPVGRVDNLAAALASALKDETERKRRGAEGKKLALSEFTRMWMVEQTLAFYREARSRAE